MSQLITLRKGIKLPTTENKLVSVTDLFSHRLVTDRLIEIDIFGQSERLVWPIK